MNYQNIIDQFLPNQYTVVTDWKDPETDEVVAIAFIKRTQNTVPNFNEPEFIIYQFDLSEISVRRFGIVFEFSGLIEGDYVPCNPTEYETLREAFIELIRFIINLRLDSFFDDSNY